VRRVVRKPVLWLALLFFAWGGLFRAWLSAPPRFVVRTGAARQVDDWTGRLAGTWSSLQGVSDDGGQVTVAIDQGDCRFADRRLEVWDTRTGADRTPALWGDAEWQRLLSAPAWWDAGIMDLLGQPAGKDFLSDEGAWAALRRRLTTGRTKALEDLRRTIRPVADSEARHLFPASTSFAPDGRRLAYVARNGWPLYVVSESLGDGTAVEDVRTGERLAFLQGVTDPVHIAPGGRTAVSVNRQAEREGEQPRLLLWDLDTSARRAGLLLPEAGGPFLVEYSADGRYVFARYSTWSDEPDGMRWWDAATGRQVGGVANPGDTAFMDGGRVLVTHPSRVRGSAACEGYVLGFWDVATGAPLGEWDLGAPADGGGMITGLVGSDGGCYLAAAYDTDCGRHPLVRPWPLDWLAGALPAACGTERQQVLVWDVVERRELASLPGSSAALSRDGRWLATLDEAGVVRVWEVPVRRPWARILGYTAACALGCWLPAVLLGRLRSRGEHPAVA
jgi:hypothetical protein